jgi:hypothetical protein
MLVNFVRTASKGGEMTRVRYAFILPDKRYRSRLQEMDDKFVDVDNLGADWSRSMIQELRDRGKLKAAEMLQLNLLRDISTVESRIILAVSYRQADAISRYALGCYIGTTFGRVLTADETRAWAEARDRDCECILHELPPFLLKEQVLQLKYEAGEYVRHYH